MSIVLDVPRGTSVLHGAGGRNFRLMALCHGGALLRSKNNAMFIKQFKPWAEVIRARFFTTILFLKIKKKLLLEHREFRCSESLRKGWSEYESMSYASSVLLQYSYTMKIWTANRHQQTFV